MYTTLKPHPDPVAFSERHDRILDFVRSHSLGVLATVDPNGEPHASVIYYTMDEHGNVFFITKRQTQKCQNLSRHNHAMLVVFEEANQTTAQVIGPVREITDVFKSQSIFGAIVRAAIRTTGNGIIPVSKLVAGEYVTYRLKPARIRMAMYNRPNGGGADKIFELLEAYELEFED